VPELRHIAVASILGAACLYLACGLVFAVMFQWKGLKRVDPAAAHPGLALRAILVPGMILLWPFLAGNWQRAAAQKAAASGLVSPGPTPEGLRKLHYWAWIAAFLAAPLILGAALLHRQPAAAPAPRPPSVQPQRP
jgi:hypothetical protein